MNRGRAKLQPHSWLHFKETEAPNSRYPCRVWENKWLSYVWIKWTRGLCGMVEANLSGRNHYWRRGSEKDVSCLLAAGSCSVGSVTCARQGGAKPQNEERIDKSSRQTTTSITYTARSTHYLHLCQSFVINKRGSSCVWLPFGSS
jgi:hypothetical protein